MDDEVGELSQSNIEAPGQPTASGSSFQLQRIEFDGNESLPDSKLQSMAESLVGREVTLSEVEGLLQAISKAYQEDGYLARVYLPEQKIENGVVRVAIVEARLGEVRYGGSQSLTRAKPETLVSYLKVGQTGGEKVKLGALNRAGILLNERPGISSQILLTAGDRVGFTDVVVVANELEPFAGSVSIDNHGSRTTGDLRVLAVGQSQNYFGMSELFQGIVLLSEGNEYGALNARMPVGSRGLTLGLGASVLEYDLIGDFEPLEANGEAFTMDLNARYPLIRSSERRVDVRARIGKRDYTNRQLGTVVSDKVINVLNLSASARLADAWFGGGQVYFSGDLVVGDLDLSGNPIYESLDALSSRTEGSYRKVDLNIGRIQRVSERSLLQLDVDAQWASKNLDSSESLVLGGPNGVRAYPVLEGSGDSGWIASLDYKYRIRDGVTVSGFYDHGKVTKKSTLQQSQRSYSLHGVGMSLNWKASRSIDLSAIIAHRFGDNPFSNRITGLDSDGSKHSWRFWIQASKSF